MAEEASQPSTLKQFIASIATIKGDLSNITAPPFLLAPISTTEFPRFWIEHPELFCAPAKEPDPARRFLAVLKWWLSCQKSQNYAGREPDQGIRKPLNAFLGEVFTGECGPDDNITKLVSEQVSHHPPVTACYLWNETNGIRAEGYSRQLITFNGSVNVQQIGHAILHIDAYDEDYLLPLPKLKINGLLTGSPYPELTDTYSIISSSGMIAEIDFSGKKMLGLTGKKNRLDAIIRRVDDVERKEVLFSAEGSWSDKFVLKDNLGGEIDVYDVAKEAAAPFRTLSLEKQDPWESRKAWANVIDGIHTGNMQQIADNKNSIQQSQRNLRKCPQTSEASWVPLFFQKAEENPKAEKLLALAGASMVENTSGAWVVNIEQVNSLTRPWRGDLTPGGNEWLVQ